MCSCVCDVVFQKLYTSDVMYCCLTSCAQVRFTRRRYTCTVLLYCSVCLCDRCNDGTTAGRGVTDRSAHSSAFIIYPLLCAQAHGRIVNFIDQIANRPNFSKNDIIRVQTTAAVASRWNRRCMREKVHLR